MTLTREVVRAVERSAAPAAVGTTLQRLIERHPSLTARLDDSAFSQALIAVTGASRSLSHLCLADEAALAVLVDLDMRRPVDNTSPGALVRWKQHELLRIAARDLTGRDDLEAVGRGLSMLAEDVLAGAWHLSGSDTEGVAIVAMGKLGGSELNYASDVDVLFVGEGHVLPLLDIARRCFRVDVGLRPEGKDGPLVRTLDSYLTYWDRWAEVWEFQALLKARPVAGDPGPGAAFAAAAAQRVWQRPFGAEQLRAIRRMKARAEGEIERRGLSDRELKRGRGGIRDIEFAIQLLQLVHGRQDPSLRSPTTLAALAELAGAGYVDADDARHLADAYRFLRTVEHRVQLVDEAQVHSLPNDPPALDRLARVLSYRDDPDRTAVSAFLGDLQRHQSRARSIHERLFFRPLLELFAGQQVGFTPDAAVTRLAAFGFTDAQRTRQALQELTRGLTRTSRMMQQLLPLLLGWLSESPDPDGGLLRLRTLIDSPHRSDVLAPAFRDSPRSARRICLLLGTSPLIASGLERHPELMAEVAALPEDGGDLSAGQRTRLGATLGWREGKDARKVALRRFKEAEEVRIAAADVLGGFGDRDVESVADRLTGLAESVLSAALETIDAPIPMAVVAMGRFGGGELSYASDLDVLLVHDAQAPWDLQRADGAAEELLAMVKGATPAERLYLLDADLRPEGRQGPLARSIGGYQSYYERWAQTWERQALLRARPIAGDAGVARRFMEVARSFVAQPLADGEEREIRRMKARIERERIPARDDPAFHLKLGRGALADIEWTAQLLQLRHGVQMPGTIGALNALVDHGRLDPTDRDMLVEAYRHCERTRNRLYLVRGVPGDALPTRPDQLAFLARSLGYTAAELRDQHRRVTRRAREVMTRLFWH